MSLPPLILQTNRQQDLYWKQLLQLKVTSEYIRRYRDELTGWVTRFAVLRAFASSGAIAGWAVFQTWPLVWAGIIATAQVADVMQRAIPFTRRQEAAGALAVLLDSLFIDAQMEWEDIFSGRLDESAVSKRRGKLMKLQHEAETKIFPSGLPLKPRLLRLAETDAATYIQLTYGTGAIE